MSAIIGVDAAKLAGLQIDLLQKVRQGHITLDHLEWFNGLAKDVRDVFAAGGKPALKPTPPATLSEKDDCLGITCPVELSPFDPESIGYPTRQRQHDPE